MDTNFYYLTPLEQKNESIMVDTILKNIHNIPVIYLCNRFYVLDIKEPGWVKIFAKYPFDDFPIGEKEYIRWHVVVRVKKYLKNHYDMVLAANVLLQCWKKCALTKLPHDVLRNVTSFLIADNYAEMRKAMQNLANYHSK
jgi:hypothetical protein